MAVVPYRHNKSPNLPCWSTIVHIGRAQSSLDYILNLFWLDYLECIENWNNIFICNFCSQVSPPNKISLSYLIRMFILAHSVQCSGPRVPCAALPGQFSSSNVVHSCDCDCINIIYTVSQTLIISSQLKPVLSLPSPWSIGDPQIIFMD